MSLLSPKHDAGGAARMLHLVRAYQVRGHEQANLDPLGLRNHDHLPELDPATYGFAQEDMDREFDISGSEGLHGFLGVDHHGTLREILEQLRALYCGNIGFEYMHMKQREKCNWLRERIEVYPVPELTKERKLQLLDRLAFADQLDHFLANKYSTAKRFGLEGVESLIPGLKFMIDRLTSVGVDSCVLGMPHRGRLNTLVNVVRKPAEMLFKEFQDQHMDFEEYGRRREEKVWASSGDVKYHLGTSYDRMYPDGRQIHLALVANPSHLEAVNPVVLGKVRAKQDMKPPGRENEVVGVLMHGDAAFAGQGVVYESMMLSQLKNYSTKGTIHLVVNNQVGFTTDPEDARSTTYCSDVGKAFDIPIFHVNADDPEAVVRVFELAAEYRQQWGEDVIIDLIGYRKHGHNELDQPAFTQPIMYNSIGTHKSCLQQYKERLVRQGICTQEEVDRVQEESLQTFHDLFEASKDYEVKGHQWLSSHWHGFFHPDRRSEIMHTGVPEEKLREVGQRLVSIPSHIELHPSLKRIMKQKEKMIETGQNLDWGTAEALAMGTLALEGNRIRLSGQDSERGTFSHRHSVLHCFKTGEEYMPLANLSPDQAQVTVANSPLSEFGVMGFELGYSLESPHQLVMWEAQFGDFVNGAQVIIDQFISSGEVKWSRQSGLTLLLPHGYDGQGPEHSSCRVERFLQMVDDREYDVPAMDDDTRTQVQNINMQVVNCSTPANFFHVLRRQIHRNFRKPLIVMSPKNLLRHKACVSDFADMAEGTRFRRAIPDCSPNLKAKPEDVRRLLICTGKVYYELARFREENPDTAGDVAILRVEQIAPFPFDYVAEEAERFPNAEIMWVQEEPQNMGCWTFVAPRIETAVQHYCKRDIRTMYHGRDPAAAPAAGSARIHQMEQEYVVHGAFER